MSRNNPPEPHTPEWCALNPNRCKGYKPESVSIESPLLVITLFVLGSFLILRKLKIINTPQFSLKNWESKLKAK